MQSSLPRVGGPVRRISLKKGVLFGLVIWLSLVACQGIAWFSVDALIVGVLLAVGGTVGVAWLIQKNRLRIAPLSSVMIAGYVLYYFILPPIATLSEGRSVAHNLETPVVVFVHALVGLMALIFAHWLYLSSALLQRIRWAISGRLLSRFGYFRQVSNTQFFVMGAVGLFAMAFQTLAFGGGEVHGALNKFVQAFYPLAYLPFCILLSGIIGSKRPISKGWIVALCSYAVLLLFVSMGRNSRSAFLLGGMSIVLCAIYALAAGRIQLRIKLRYLFGGAVVLVFLMGPIADLATGMVIVRSQRESLPPIQMVQETIKVFKDKDAIKAWRAESSSPAFGWNEHYVDNVFLARVANLKFTDNIFVLVSQLGQPGLNFLRSIELQKSLSVLPRPILDVVAPWVDKDLVGSASGGDFVLFAATGKRYVLGGFRTGSLLGSAYAIFGSAYPVALAFVLLPLFVIADAQTTRSGKGDFADPLIAPLVAVTFFTWTFFLTSAATGAESFSSIVQLVTRGWLQSLLVYSIGFTVSLVIVRALTKRF